MPSYAKCPQHCRRSWQPSSLQWCLSLLRKDQLLDAKHVCFTAAARANIPCGGTKLMLVLWAEPASGARTTWRTTEKAAPFPASGREVKYNATTRVSASRSHSLLSSLFRSTHADTHHDNIFFRVVCCRAWGFYAYMGVFHMPKGEVKETTTHND